MKNKKTKNIKEIKKNIVPKKDNKKSVTQKQDIVPKNKKIIEEKPKKEYSNKILILDSDKDVVYGIRDYVKNNEIEDKYKAEFLFAEDVIQALEIIKKNKIKMISLELVLPIVNGFHFLEFIKSKKIPVVIYTKLKENKDLERLFVFKNIKNIKIKQFSTLETLVPDLNPNEKSKANVKNLIANIETKQTLDTKNETNSNLKVLKCPKCNMMLNKNSHFCSSCGQRIFNLATDNNKS